MFVYDKTGALMEKADAFRTRDKSLSQAILFFSNSETLKVEALDESYNLSMFKSSPVAVFSKLNGLVPNTSRTLPPGPYLIAVYIDNALLSGPFSIVALPAKTCEESSALVHAEKSLQEAKERLSLLELEYARTKAAYDATLAKMRDEDDLTEALLQAREDAYKSYLMACGSAYVTDESHPTAVEFDEFDRREKPPTTQIDVSRIFKTATTQASLASGWLASRFATGLTAIQRNLYAENASVTSSTEGHYADTVKGEPEDDEYPAAPASTSQAAEDAKRPDAIDDMFESVMAEGSESNAKTENEDL